jgi:hypothetical protein
VNPDFFFMIRIILNTCCFLYNFRAKKFTRIKGLEKTDRVKLNYGHIILI